MIKELVTRVFYCERADLQPDGTYKDCDATATLTQPRDALTLPEGWRWVRVRSDKGPYEYRKLSCGRHGEHLADGK